MGGVRSIKIEDWNLEDCSRIEEFMGSARAPLWLDLSPDGRRLAVACGDKKTRVYGTAHLPELLR